MPHSDTTVTTNMQLPPNCDRWLRQRKRKDSKLESDSGQFLEGNERDVFHSASERTKHAIRAAIHCEVVITRANERAICPHIKVLTNEGLFIIAEHKSSHNPISCLLILMAGGEAHLGRRRTKESKLGFGLHRVTSV